MIGLIYIILASLLWALDTLIRYPLLGSGASPERIVITEHVILFLFFMGVLYNAREKIWNAKISHAFYFLMIGALGSAYATLAFTKAFTLLNPSLVILLQKLQPIVVIVLARIILGETVARQFIVWALITLLGGFLVSYKDIMPGLLNFDFESLSANSLQGYTLTMFAVVGWGSALVFGKKLSLLGYNEKEIMAGRFTMGLFALLPLLIWTPIELSGPPMSFLKILVMVILSGLIAMYLYYKGLRQVPARLGALAEMFFPFFAVILNWMILGYSLDYYQIAGGALLVVGSTVIQLKRY